MQIPNPYEFEHNFSAFFATFGRSRTMNRTSHFLTEVCLDSKQIESDMDLIQITAFPLNNVSFKHHK